jgi:7-cyano-7-deazaguanine synthase
MSLALLLSGGQDSVALAYMLRPALAITIDYGQLPAQAELVAATQVCDALNLEHVAIRVDCSQLGSGDLAGKQPLGVAPVSEWWPYRNQLLVTLAAAAALARGTTQLAIGTVSTDASHTDGSHEFIEAMDGVLSLQEGGLRLVAPAIGMTSANLIRRAGVPSEILAWAHSCHTSRWACGACRGCVKHKNVMHELGYEPY